MKKEYQTALRYTLVIKGMISTNNNFITAFVYIMAGD